MAWVVDDDNSVISTEWDDPTVTNLETDMTVDMFVGNATEAGDFVNFDARFRIGYPGNTANWVTASPRLSLPIPSSNPSRIIGTGAGYGGSGAKLFQTFSENVRYEGDITFGGRTQYAPGRGLYSSIFSTAKDDDGVIYIAGYSYIYTLNVETRDATIYAADRNRFYSIPGLAWHDGTLYALRNNALYTVTPTGSTRVGKIFNSDQYNNVLVYGLESFDGTLYVTGHDNLNLNHFFGTVDTTTGLATNGMAGSGIDTSLRFIRSLFSYDGSLYGVNGYGSTADEGGWTLCVFTDLATGAVRELYELPHRFDASFVSGDRVYFIDYPKLYSVDFSFGPIASVDFRGDTYTSAIGQVGQEGNLIQVDIEKMQSDTYPVSLSMSGSYRK